MDTKRVVFRASAKFYVLLAAIAALGAGAWVYVVNSDTTVATNDTTQFTAVVPAVVVRDEEVIASESYGKANYLVPDQQRIEAQAPVVEVYKWGYNEKVMDDLVDVRTKILQYEAGEPKTTDAELADLNIAIDETTRQFRADESEAGSANAAALENELRELMGRRARLLDEASVTDQQLEEYRKQEQQLEERVSSWSDIWNAGTSGVVSYYFDGYEPVLNADTIRSASAAQVRQILDGTLPIAQVADGTEPLYRLVNNFQWYIVIPSTQPILEFSNDNVFAVSFEDYPERQFEGTIIGHISEGTDHLYVMEFNEDIGALLSTRRTVATISASFSGISVPQNAVVSRDGQNGVYVVAGKQRDFVPVTIRAQQGDTYIVEPIESGSALTEGAHVAA